MGLSLEMHPNLTLELGIEKKKKLLAAIAREKKLFPLEEERIELFRQLVSKIFDILPEDEQESFAENPTDYRSQRFLFRGLDHDKTTQLLQDEKMIPQAGQYGSEAVFFTDNPLGAASFMPPDGSLVIIDRKNVSYLRDGESPSNVSDPEFKKKFNQRLESLPPEDQREAAYTGINNWDTEEPYSAGRTWKIVALRREQPLTAISAMLVPNKTKQKVISLNPNTKSHRQILTEQFLRNEAGQSATAA